MGLTIATQDVDYQLHNLAATVFFVNFVIYQLSHSLLFCYAFLGSKIKLLLDGLLMMFWLALSALTLSMAGFWLYRLRHDTVLHNHLFEWLTVASIWCFYLPFSWLACPWRNKLLR